MLLIIRLKRFWFSPNAKNFVETVTKENDNQYDYYQNNEQMNHR